MNLSVAQPAGRKASIAETVRWFRATYPEAEMDIYYAGYQDGYQDRQIELDAWRDYGEQALRDITAANLYERVHGQAVA